MREVGRLVHNGTGDTAFYVVGGKFAKLSLTTLGRLCDNETGGTSEFFH